MRVNIRILFFVLALAAPSALWAGCDQNKHEEFKLVQANQVLEMVSDTQFQELLALDFTGEIRKCKVDNSSEGALAGASEPVEKQLLLDDFVTPNGVKRQLSFTTALIGMYYSKNNKRPATGADLFPELLTNAGFQGFMQMDSAARFERYMQGINPLTGHFYKTFEDSWNPGGISWVPKPLEGDHSIVAGKRTLNIKGDVGIKAKYEYKVFGSKQPEVLLSDIAVEPISGMEENLIPFVK